MIYVIKNFSRKPKKVDNVEWSHYVDIVIPNETITETGIMFIDGGVTDEAKHVIFRAGQSKRIWNELYKVNFSLG